MAEETVSRAVYENMCHEREHFLRERNEVLDTLRAEEEARKAAEAALLVSDLVEIVQLDYLNSTPNDVVRIAYHEVIDHLREALREREAECERLREVLGRIANGDPYVPTLATIIARQALDA